MGVTPGSAGQTQTSHISTLRSWMSPDGKKTSRFLYVSEPGQSAAGRVDVISVPKHSLVAKITHGIDKPEGLAVDTNGNLYVANLNSDTVTVYHPRRTRPSLRLDVPDPPSTLRLEATGTFM
jgi:sugar lactone lactonase YvrE